LTECGLLSTRNIWKISTELIAQKIEIKHLKAPNMLPMLYEVEEIEAHIASRPPDCLNDDEIISELEHWNTLCRTRLWEEGRKSAKKVNPISKANVVRLGGTGFGLLGLLLHVVLPPIAIALAAAGVIMEAYNEFVEFLGWRARKAVEKPIGIIHQRCVALEQERDNRSRR
jgi:hypothetical protein